MGKVIAFRRFEDKRLELVADELETCSRTLHCMSQEMEKRIVPGLTGRRGEVLDKVLTDTLSQTSEVITEILNLGNAMNGLRALLVDKDI